MAAPELQRKFRFGVTFNFPIELGLPNFGNVPADEVTHASKTRTVVSRRNQKLGFVSLTAGPAELGELTIRLALRIAAPSSNNTIAALIGALQSLIDSDSDTVTVTVTQLDGLTVVGSDGGNPSYSQAFDNCRVIAYTLDPLNRRSDDDFVHCEVRLQPSAVSRVAGREISLPFVVG